MARLKVGVLISGRGSNMRALLEAAADPAFPAEIVLVISNNPAAGGLEVARGFGVATAAIDHRKRTREAFEAEVDSALRAAGVAFVCLAGFMRILTAGFVSAWQGRMVNIHPSLLPSFKGVHVHEQALAAGVRFSGCSVHFVVPEMDDGPIIIQAAVPVRQDDTPATLAARVLLAEHEIYPKALRWAAEGRLIARGNTVEVSGAGAAAPYLVNPVAQ